MIHCIRKLLNHPDTLAERQKPYLNVQVSINKYNVEQAKITKQKLTRLEEVEVAEMFSKFGRTIIEECGAEMPLRFAEYKRTILRKTCQLTGERLPEQLSQRQLWVKDKSLPVTRGNVCVTTNIIAESLDKFSVNSKMGFKQMTKLFKGVVK